MYQTIVKNFSSLFLQYLPCIPATQLEEPTIPITLKCSYKKKLYCGQQWCQLHLVRSLFCTIVSFIVLCVVLINTSVHHHCSIFIFNFVFLLFREGNKTYFGGPSVSWPNAAEQRQSFYPPRILEIVFTPLSPKIAEKSPHTPKISGRD